MVFHYIANLDGAALKNRINRRKATRDEAKVGVARLRQPGGYAANAQSHRLRSDMHRRRRLSL